MTDNKNKVVIFSNNMKEYYIGEIVSVEDNKIWKLKNVAQIFPIGDNLFVPLGFALPDRNGLKIIPLSEFHEDVVFIEEPRMWAYANKRITRKYEDFVRNISAKRSGIVLAKDMKEAEKIGKYILTK